MVAAIRIQNTEYRTPCNWILNLLAMYLDISSQSTTVPQQNFIDSKGGSICFLVKKVKPEFLIFHRNKVRQELITSDPLLVKLDEANNLGLSITDG